MDRQSTFIYVIGASGFLGSAIYSKFKNHAYVVGTYNHCHSSGLRHFDLLAPEADSSITTNEYTGFREKIAVMCSCSSQIDYCAINKDETFKINVTNTILTIRKLSDAGFRIMFISTDNVFSGNEGDYKETDNKNPINEYGRQKAAVEDFLIDNIKSFSILRLSKLVSSACHRKNMFTEWHGKITSNEDIACIKNNIFSPTDICDVVHGTELLIRKKLTGIYHVANMPVSRYDLALRFYKMSGIKSNTRIYEKDMHMFNFKDKRALNSSLDSTKIKNETGIVFTPMGKTITKYISGCATI